MMFPLSDLVIIAPELVLIIGAMVLLMAGVFLEKRLCHKACAYSRCLVMNLAILLLLGVASFYAWCMPVNGTRVVNGMLIIDGFGQFMKILCLIGAVLSLVMGQSWIRQENMYRFEFPVLVVFSCIGMVMMIAANDLLSLYVGLELQSLSLYVLAAFRRDSVKAAEAGLKYFVLGALSSGLLLYGISLLYGFSGGLSFDHLAEIFAAGPVRAGAIIGLVFVLSGLAFKISAVPFHMWTPDVYEGAPTPVTAFFALAPKVAAMGLLARVLTGPFGAMTAQWQQVIIVMAVASMVVGAFGAIAQTNIKRLMAYSSIGHMGYLLAALAANTTQSIAALCIYLALYVFMGAASFAVVLRMRRNGQALESVSDLAGISRTNPALAAVMAICMFSMAGIPPLAGFFSKLVVFQAVIASGFYALAIIGVVTSVVSAFYYLRIIKVMYFDAASAVYDAPSGSGISIVMLGSTFITLMFWAMPAPLMAIAQKLASAMVGG